MKRSLWILVFLAVLILAGHASAQSCTPAPSGMIGWWPGDGNASDIQWGR
jgi:hypothetical protein